MLDTQECKLDDMLAPTFSKDAMCEEVWEDHYGATK